MFIVAVVWGVSLTDHKMIARYDSESIMTVHNSRYSKEPHVMNMMQTLFLNQACHWLVVETHLVS